MTKKQVMNRLGSTIYYRAQDYYKKGRVRSLSYSNQGNIYFNIVAGVTGSRRYRVSLCVDEDGGLLDGSCSCPYNENGEGELCKHIGAAWLEFLNQAELLEDREAPKPMEIAGVMSGTEYAQRYAGKQGEQAERIESLFGKKWKEDIPESDSNAKSILKFYQREEQTNFTASAEEEKILSGSVHLDPELELSPRNRKEASLRVYLRSGKRNYVVKSIPELCEAVEQHKEITYGKMLSFVHKAELFDEESRKLLEVLGTESDKIRYAEKLLNGYWNRNSTGKVGEVIISGREVDELFELYLPQKRMGNWILEDGCPPLLLHVQKEKGGMLLRLETGKNLYAGKKYGYLYDGTSNRGEDRTIWRISPEKMHLLEPLIKHIGQNAFFTKSDGVSLYSYLLPVFGENLKLDDPNEILEKGLPEAPTVQFYLDANDGTVQAYCEFVYGEKKITPFIPEEKNILRDRRTEQRAEWLLQGYLQPTPQKNGLSLFEAEDDDEKLYRFLEQGVSALMAEGEVYLTDAFRRIQIPSPHITVGVSVDVGGLLDLQVDMGEFPTEELRELLHSIRRKKHYHRLKDGRLLRLDDSMQVLEDLSETLEMSGVAEGKTTARLPLYRAPGLDRALSGQKGVEFKRDAMFRQISRSFQTVQDSDYTPPKSLENTLRKYQREGYRWLRTLDAYGMGGILADDMGLGKTLQVLAYLLACKEEGQTTPSLIVCPASLVLNWAEECAKFTPQLRCLTIDGTAAHRAELIETFGQQDIIITSYDLLRRDVGKYKEKKFYACIIDEAQAIKNYTTQKYKAVCQIQSHVRFALTGTPVENRLGELWSIFSFLMPGYLYSYKTFSERLEKPIVQEQSDKAMERLNQLTSPFLLRRIKGDVLKELPPKIENTYHVRMDTDQKKLYTAAVLEAKEKLRAAAPEDRMAVFSVLLRLRQICCDPRLLVQDWTGSSAKLEATAELLSTAVEGGHHALIFSQFTSMLELLAEKLDELGISHFTLQGSTPKPERAKLVKRFNAGEADVFLISLRAGGTGLNLTAADIVVHYDPWWNVAAQNQATDRAYRMGQTNTVQVYKMIMQGTIEEKIVEMQDAKQTLAASVVNTADGAILSMRPDELLELLDDKEA